MKPQDKAKELSECFDERMGCYVVDDEKYEQFMQMHEWTKNELLKNATDITINRDFLYDIKQYIHEKYLDYKVGEKIKLVLIKEK